MKLEITSYSDAGNSGKERLILKALSDVDIGDYIIFCSHVSNSGGPVAGRKTAYWFPDEKLKTGDLLALYTKKGADSKKKISGDRTAHFYYWGLETTIWGGSGNVAVLLLTSDWASKVREEPK
jgi:hypothetical protein